MKFTAAGNPTILNQTQIKNRALALKSRIDKLDECYKDLQQICTHPNKISKRDSSTGNWDRNDDCYWIKNHCPDCDKRWYEDQ